VAVTLSDEEIEVVRSVLRMLMETIRGSSTAPWTATDEFIDTYLRAMSILSGDGDPGENVLLQGARRA
jgi:hypothetical protein